MTDEAKLEPKLSIAALQREFGLNYVSAKKVKDVATVLLERERAAWNRRAGEGADFELPNGDLVPYVEARQGVASLLDKVLTADERIARLEQRGEWADPLAGMMSELADRFAPENMKGENTFSRSLVAVDHIKSLAERVRELEDELDDYRDGLRRVAEERTHGDEKHCACVPHYRELLRDRTADVVRVAALLPTPGSGREGEK